jgi:acetyl-CoA synthetase
MGVSVMQIQTRDDVEAQVQQLLATYDSREVCLANLLCDRHAEQPDRVALRYEDASGTTDQLTYADLRDASTRFAGVLRDLGVSRGDRVATLLPKVPELMIATLALWRLGAAHVPMFTAFGPRPIQHRLQDSSAKVIVTDEQQRPKLNSVLRDWDSTAMIPPHVVVVSPNDRQMDHDTDISFWATLHAARPVQSAAVLTGDDLCMLPYTSGTTGSSKGVEVPVKALASFEAYMRFGYDIREDDVFWNMADPGWAYGLWYALVGPLLLGHTTIFYDAPFEPEGIYRILEKYGVTNFAAAPTAYRALRSAGTPPGLKGRLRLRSLSSAGEPLNPDVITWSEKYLGVPIHDHYGQTEQGMLVNNHHAASLRRPIRPGSMGHAMPGYRMVVVDDAGREPGPGQQGQLALDLAASPLCWFRGYRGAPERTAERFIADGRYYLTGDAAHCDEDGYIFAAGRTDDVITSAGYRIGPFDVESALVAHPSVAEAAVIGKPDALRGEIVKAFVVLKPGFVAGDGLTDELGQFVKTSLSAHAYPREIEVVDSLPKTASGKIQRFLLRERA